MHSAFLFHAFHQIIYPYSCFPMYHFHPFPRIIYMLSYIPIFHFRVYLHSISLFCYVCFMCIHICHFHAFLLSYIHVSYFPRFLHFIFTLIVIPLSPIHAFTLCAFQLSLCHFYVNHFPSFHLCIIQFQPFQLVHLSWFHFATNVVSYLSQCPCSIFTFIIFILIYIAQNHFQRFHHFSESHSIHFIFNLSTFQLTCWEMTNRKCENGN